MWTSRYARSGAALLLGVLISSVAVADCWTEAAARYGHTPLELAAVACVESGLNPKAYSRDEQGRPLAIGLMGIYRGHLPGLAKYGIRMEHLSDACVSVNLGAWVLADFKTRYGNTWQAYGAYNASCTKLKGSDCVRARSKYAWQVWRAMRNLEGKGRC